MATAKPGFLKINGTSPKTPTGSLVHKDGEATGEFTFDLTELKTGVDLRDEHMKDKYLEVKKYPEAKLKLHPIKDWNPDKDNKGSFTGDLSLHNETKKVSGQYKYIGKSKDLVADFSFKVSDFNIEVPSHLGVVVGEEVKVNVKLGF